MDQNLRKIKSEGDENIKFCYSIITERVKYILLAKKEIKTYYFEYLYAFFYNVKVHNIVAADHTFSNSEFKSQVEEFSATFVSGLSH